MYYKIKSETLDQVCVIKKKKGNYEMICEDGVKYSEKEIFLLYMLFLIKKKEPGQKEFPKVIHDIKKAFDGEIININ